MPRKKKETKNKKILKKIARVHAIFSVALFGLYVALSAIYSPEFLLSDVRHKFSALADETITIIATVLDAPQKPIVVGEAICSSGNLSVDLDWADDVNSQSFDVSRDSLPLVTGLLNSEYSDTVVTVGTSYDYVVTARGEMDPGFAESDLITVTTPAECAVVLPDPEITVTSFDGKSVGSYVGTPATTNQKPVFSGTTNIPNANIYILISSGTVISANINANIGGFWTWTPPVNIPVGSTTFFVSATSPSDPLRTISTTFPFIINAEKTSKDDDDEKTDKKKKTTSAPVSPFSPPTTPGVPYQGGIEQIPLDFSLTIAPQSVYQGKDIGALIRIERLDPQYEGVGAIVRYRIFDEKGNREMNILADAVLHAKGSIHKNISIPTYFKSKKYKIQAEIIIDKYNVSREKYFTVMPLPIINLGGGFMITYPELLSFLGTGSLWLLLLLIIWFIFFSREYWLYLHALRHITERNLARIGLFGMMGGKGVSR